VNGLVKMVIYDREVCTAHHSQQISDRDSLMMVDMSMKGFGNVNTLKVSKIAIK
jgi:hypothetical protein